MCLVHDSRLIMICSGNDSVAERTRHEEQLGLFPEWKQRTVSELIAGSETNEGVCDYSNALVLVEFCLWKVRQKRGTSDFRIQSLSSFLSIELHLRKFKSLVGGCLTPSTLALLYQCTGHPMNWSCSHSWLVNFLRLIFLATPSQMYTGVYTQGDFKSIYVPTENSSPISDDLDMALFVCTLLVYKR